jgi:hypothetical protein
VLQLVPSFWLSSVKTFSPHPCYLQSVGRYLKRSRSELRFANSSLKALLLSCSFQDRNRTYEMWPELAA